MPDKPTPSITNPTHKLVHTEDFVSVYANSVFTDATAWDIKLTFGQFDEIDGVSATKQQVSVTMPFGAAKVMMYWIEASLIAHEVEIGRPIGIRQNARPKPLPPLTTEEQKDPNLVKYRKAMDEMLERF